MSKKKKIVFYCIFFNLIIGNILFFLSCKGIIFEMSISAILFLSFIFKYSINKNTHKFILVLLAFFTTLGIEMLGICLYSLFSELNYIKEIKLQTILNVLFNSLKGIPLVLLGNVFIFPDTIILSIINYNYFVKYRNALLRN